VKNREITEYIAVHCSATPPHQEIGEDEIRRMHKAKGWEDAGYNVVIRRNGKIDIARPLDAQGAHVRGYNHNSVGVCLVGGVDDDGKAENNFTPIQMDSLELTLHFLFQVYPGAIAKGHRAFFGDTNKDGVIDSRDWLKQCPCFDVEGFLIKRGFSDERRKND